MLHSKFKISNNEENVINLANLLFLWSTLQLFGGVDHKDRYYSVLKSNLEYPKAQYIIF